VALCGIYKPDDPCYVSGGRRSSKYFYNKQSYLLLPFYDNSLTTPVAPNRILSVVVDTISKEFLLPKLHVNAQRKE
jgi:hypothetical protein